MDQEVFYAKICIRIYTNDRKIVENGINKKEIIDGDKNVIASGIFGFTCSSLIYKMRTDKEINVQELYSEIEKTFIRKLKR